jgi:DNA-binding beta-propeller fold protein YncE
VRKSSVILTIVLFLMAFPAASAATPPLKLVAKYRMPASVKGPKFDHLAVDVPGNRLFATAESDHEVLVFNLHTGEYLRSIKGIEIPHAVHVSDSSGRIFVTDGGAGGVQVFDGKTYNHVKFIPLKMDSDSIGYDPQSRKLYVVNGGGDAHETFSMLSVVSTESATKVADIKLDGDTLEQMAIAHDSPLLYDSARSLNRIDVIDRRTRTLVHQWPVTMGQVNVSIAFDEPDHRLFSACRSGVIVAFDTKTGKELKSVPIDKNVDDLIFDSARKRLYASTAAGYIDVYQVNGPDNYVSLGRFQVAPGSKNEVFSSPLNRLYTTVPPQGGNPGEIYVFQVE